MTLPVLVGVVILGLTIVGLIVFGYFVAIKPDLVKRRERGLPLFRTGKESLPYLLGAAVLVIAGSFLLSHR